MKLLPKIRSAIKASTPVLLALIVLGLWHGSHHAGAPNPPQGHYHSSGTVQLNDGRVVQVSHNIRFQGDRFYAMSRQGDTLFESSGALLSDGAGYQLQIERGEVSGLGPDLDNILVFNLLYSRHRGASITLHPIGDCLYARESLQVFCP